MKARQRQLTSSSIPLPHLTNKEAKAQRGKRLSPETSGLVGREALLPLAVSLDGEKRGGLWG